MGGLEGGVLLDTLGIQCDVSILHTIDYKVDSWSMFYSLQPCVLVSSSLSIDAYGAYLSTIWFSLDH